MNNFRTLFDGSGAGGGDGAGGTDTGGINDILLGELGDEGLFQAVASNPLAGVVTVAGQFLDGVTNPVLGVNGTEIAAPVFRTLSSQSPLAEIGDQITVFGILYGIAQVLLGEDGVVDWVLNPLGL